MLKMTSKELLGVEDIKKNQNIEQLLRVKKTENNGIYPPQICKMPPSSVLSNVKKFLPLLKEANRQLDNVPASDLDIECIPETNDQVIEMNIALFKQSDDSNDSESTDDSSNESFYGEEVTEENIKIVRYNIKKPHIEELVDKNLEPGFGTS